MRSVDERTAQARIRDAAIEVFAEHGTTGITARSVAEVAGVSPALVIHHFGSMEGLREACDEFVIGTIRDTKTESLASGPTFDLGAMLRDAEFGALPRYLARRLVEDSPTTDRFVDELVDDTLAYMEAGVAAGTLRPTVDPRGRAIALLTWQLGSLVLHRHLERLIGVDILSHDLQAADLAEYAMPVVELYSEGLFTEEFAETVRTAFAAQAEDTPDKEHQ